MEVLLCRCSFGIPGVEELPLHSHVYTGNLVGTGRYFDKGPFKGQEIEALEMDQERIHLVVDWKEVYRASQATQVQGNQDASG